MNTPTIIAQLTGIILNYEEENQSLKVQIQALTEELNAISAKENKFTDTMKTFEQLLPMGLQLLQQFSPPESQENHSSHESQGIILPLAPEAVVWNLASDLKTLSGEAVKAIVDKLDGTITEIPDTIIEELRSKNKNTRWFLDSLLGIDFLSPVATPCCGKIKMVIDGEQNYE